MKIALKFQILTKIKIMLVKSLQYFKKSGLSIKKLRNLRFFRFGSLSVAYHAHKGFGLWTLGFHFGSLCGPFLAAKKIFGNLQKTLDIPVSVCYTRGE